MFLQRFLVSNAIPLFSRITMAQLHISELRKKYNNSNTYLSEDSLESKNPIKLFETWLNVAKNANIKEPNAMTLATVNENGHPTARMVILRGYGEDGFKFHTNYRSAKAKDLENNPKVALVLYWVDLCRSVRIEGLVKKLSKQESDEEFAKRPRSTKIIAVASTHQSSPVANAEELALMAKTTEEQYKDNEIDRPNYFGGYCVTPERIEFWQGQSSRMSDRIVFVKNVKEKDCWKEGQNGWMYQRLQP
uniref:Pyridoxine-5'-phosphate oxidase n=1 Tax=Phallusia mammillata TaxID=59560 RepID=A0A6F9DQ18_9ASCI|nr:pyridoxine-5'-phosphate oxidase-like [Phallusia mammillata]